MIGKVVNYRYEVLEKCGDGSFFSVYKARDKVLNRLVAVKILVPPYSQNPDFAARLIDESQVVGDLNHPNIARVFESDSHDSVYFMAVEYVRGVNLKDRIRRTGPFAVSYAVDIAAAVAQALDFAHRSGVVHGDVRPHNVITSPEGQVKLTDFGTAKALAAFPAIREATMLRSVHYMAPEVIRGEPARVASDIYSLGVMLYEMLTGSVPYDGPTSAAVAAKQLQDPVQSPQQRNSGIPALLGDIVVIAMQKDPDRRYATAAEFAGALERVKEWLRTGQAPSAPTVRPEFEAPIQSPDDMAYEPEVERAETMRKSFPLMLLGVFVVAIVTAILFVTLNPGAQPSGMPVPNLVGMNIVEARKTAEKHGWTLIESRDYNESVPTDQVYKTDPAAGHSMPRSQPNVQVWVSMGPKKFIVPDLVGMTSDDARKRLVDIGFVPGGTTSEYSPKVPADHVISQTPQAGEKLEPSKPVDIVVSLGPVPAPVTPQPQTNPDETVTQREIKVPVQVPTEPDRQRIIRVDVYDAAGNRTFSVTKTMDPGANEEIPVKGEGDNVHIQVYIDDELANDYKE